MNDPVLLALLFLGTLGALACGLLFLVDRVTQGIVWVYAVWRGRGER